MLDPAAVPIGGNARARPTWSAGTEPSHLYGANVTGITKKEAGTVTIACATAGALTAVAPMTSQALQVNVTIENLAPVNGVYLTRLWVGFHDGSFDIYDVGAPAPEYLERLAEDGDTTAISAAFTGSVQGTLFGPLAPGDVTSMVFTIDPALAQYFSYGAVPVRGRPGRAGSHASAQIAFRE